MVYGKTKFGIISVSAFFIFGRKKVSYEYTSFTTCIWHIHALKKVYYPTNRKSLIAKYCGALA